MMMRLVTFIPVTLVIWSLICVKRGESCFPGVPILGDLRYVPSVTSTTRQCTVCTSRELQRQISELQEEGGSFLRNFMGSTTTTCCPTTTAATTTTPSTATTTASSSSCKCGVKKVGTRVVGGQNSQVNEYPWIVGLKFSGSSTFGCGGTLINSRWVVTAAHCLVRSGSTAIAPSSLVVVLGEWDQTSTTDTTNLKTVSVSQIVVKSGYVSSSNKDDIAMMKLAETIDLTAYTPACLPAANTDYNGQKAWIYGWGTTSSGGSVSAILKEAEVTIVSDSVCQGTFDPYGITIIDSMICAGANGIDTCQGDSGGPMTVPVGTDNIHYLAGLTSFGVGCALANTYGVYSELSKFRSFIDTTVSGNGGGTYCTG